MEKRELIKIAIQCVYESRCEYSLNTTKHWTKLIPLGPHRAKGNRKDGCCGRDGKIEGDEKQHVNRVSLNRTPFSDEEHGANWRRMRTGLGIGVRAKLYKLELQLRKYLHTHYENGSKHTGLPAMHIRPLMTSIAFS